MTATAAFLAQWFDVAAAPWPNFRAELFMDAANHLPKNHHSRLKTQASRLCLVLSPIGLFVAISVNLMFDPQSSNLRSNLRSALDSLSALKVFSFCYDLSVLFDSFFSLYGGTEVRIIRVIQWLGIGWTIGALVAAFWYEQTVGRIISWVRSGT